VGVWNFPAVEISVSFCSTGIHFHRWHGI